jgi:hypothetical protein
MGETGWESCTIKEFYNDKVTILCLFTRKLHAVAFILFNSVNICIESTRSKHPVNIFLFFSGCHLRRCCVNVFAQSLATEPTTQYDGST